MMIKIHNRPLNILAVCLALLVYGSTLLNHMVYYHSHITNDGRLVSHAHPFNKSQDSTPFKSHHHSAIDLLLLFGDGFHHFSRLYEDFNLVKVRISIHHISVKKIDFKFPWVIDKQRGPPNKIAA